MREVFHLLDRLTDTRLPVLISGESGTGKELVARALHFNGPRKDRPFVSENCAAIPETLLESILFGHVRGAFTGADRDRRGLFEVADGGTLFLDEVGETSPAMQAKLLRVVQSGEFRRVGDERMRKADVRLVCASNRDLRTLVQKGEFREDLYYRLDVARVELPPLRERRDDIPLLVAHLLDKVARASGTPVRRVERAALARLCNYDWPGNVRELENELMRVAALAQDSIGVRDLSREIARAAAAGLPGDEGQGEGEPGGPGLLRDRVERLERELIEDALRRSRGNHTRAAALLGLSRFGLLKKLRRYAIEGPPEAAPAGAAGSRAPVQGSPEVSAASRRSGRNVN
jgi:DNA-binding NtrC family response regulator